MIWKFLEQLSSWKRVWRHEKSLILLVRKFFLPSSADCHVNIVALSVVFCPFTTFIKFVYCFIVLLTRQSVFFTLTLCTWENVCLAWKISWEMLLPLMLKCKLPHVWEGCKSVLGWGVVFRGCWTVEKILITAVGEWKWAVGPLSRNT